MRAPGRTSLAECGTAFEQQTKSALLEVIVGSIQRDWSIAQPGLPIRLFGQAGDVQFLVEVVTGELCHEMGVRSAIGSYSMAIADDEAGDPRTRLGPTRWRRMCLANGGQN